MTSWRRRQRLRAAGGKHSRKEIQDIVTIQNGRCIYCNVRFTKRVPPTKDHLLAIADGGANWGLNILMACRSCHSRRCDLPFRTYCKLLSPAQNRRILLHLSERLLSPNFDNSPSENRACFDLGLALHNPKHWRYRNIQQSSATAQRNAKLNSLLPPTANRILEKIIKQLRMKLRKTKKKY